MRRVHIARLLLVAIAAIGPTTGCFVGSELDQANATASSAAAKSMNPTSVPGGAKPDAAADAKPGAPKGDAAASNKPAAPSGAAWWKTARTLSSESTDASIAPCDLNGRMEFMHREDCLARGGRAK
jgi:hypothetical protein